MLRFPGAESLPKGMAAEGEATMIPCKGSAENVIFELTEEFGVG